MEISKPNTQETTKDTYEIPEDKLTEKAKNDKFKEMVDRENLVYRTNEYTNGF